MNFSDDLAHVVITINLPFVNLRSLELQEHMKYVNRLKMKFNLQRKPGQKDAASNLYENMCMNAINQTSKYW
jgi:chromosome transmission fidelity protein 1